MGDRLQKFVDKAVDQYGETIIDELDGVLRGHHFAERLVLGLIAANPSPTEKTQRFRTAMNALFGPSWRRQRRDAKNDSAALEWMAGEWIADGRSGNGRCRSVEELAVEAVPLADKGKNSEAIVARLKRTFDSNRQQLLAAQAERSVALEMIHRAGLHDIDEVLQHFGVNFHPDD